MSKSVSTDFYFGGGVINNVQIMRILECIIGSLELMREMVL